MKILIVEDEFISAMTLEAYLEDEGYTVQHAASGREALKCASDFMPDILISDWKIRDEIDGIAVARELKKINPSLRTIFYSGMGIDDMRSKSEGLEVFCFLEKPCGLQEMLGVVKRAAACLC